MSARELWVPALLLALSAVPIGGVVARLVSLSSPATADNVRFHAAPMPVIFHVVGAALYSVVGALQFSSALRRCWPGWHRRAGKVVALCGLSTALSGLWMTALYPIPSSLQGPLLYSVRMMVGIGMSTAIIVAWSSIRRREVARHEAWMIRAYALGQGAGTQVVLLLPVIVLSGEVVGLTRDLLMSLAWATNVLFAEWIIWRRSR